MNRDDVMALANQTAGQNWMDEAHIQRFAALAAAAERDKWEAKFKQLEALMRVRERQPNKPCCLAEREACAKVCDDLRGYPGAEPDVCAAAIRARGQA